MTMLLLFSPSALFPIDYSLLLFSIYGNVEITHSNFFLSRLFVCFLVVFICFWLLSVVVDLWYAVCCVSLLHRHNQTLSQTQTHDAQFNSVHISSTN